VIGDNIRSTRSTCAYVTVMWAKGIGSEAVHATSMMKAITVI